MRAACETRKSLHSSTTPSAGTRLPAAELDDVAGHDVPCVDRLPRPVPQRRHPERQAIAQARHRGRSAILLREGQQTAADYDQQDDRGVGPLPEQQRDAGAEDEDQDQRALDLPKQQPEGARRAGWGRRSSRRDDRDAHRHPVASSPASDVPSATSSSLGIVAPICLRTTAIRHVFPIPQLSEPNEAALLAQPRASASATSAPVCVMWRRTCSLAPPSTNSRRRECP